MLYLPKSFKYSVVFSRYYILSLFPPPSRSFLQEKYQVAKILEDAENQPPMKSKDFMSRVIPSGSDYKGLNYYTSEMDRISSSSQSLEHSFNAGSPVDYAASAADADDTYEREADRTEYAETKTFFAGGWIFRRKKT